MRGRFLLAKTVDLDYLQGIRGFRRVLQEIREADGMVSIPFTRYNLHTPF